VSTLTIHHVPGTEPPLFNVMRGDQTTAKPAPVASPVGFPVKGRPDSDLMRELRWYLEDFLDYPFPPDTDRAERVLDALRAWGKKAFNDLFGIRPASRMFDEATAQGYQHLDLRIAGDDPRILQWPWEALVDPEAAPLAVACRMERRLNDVRDPVDLPEGLPKDRLNVLLVTARPYEADVGYRSISRPLVELIEKENIPAHVHVLRPPTFGNLREHLAGRPGFYHIIHFDGHGGYRHRPVTGQPPYTFAGPQGALVFEDARNQPDVIPAEHLCNLMRDNAVPVMVLNACRSGMVNGKADDPFASVAAALIKAGIRGVVAMAYTVYVAGAKVFLPAFYKELFRTGDLSRATRAGRQKMHEKPGRVCARGRYELDDFIVPVAYQQAPCEFAFAGAGAPAKPLEKTALPEGATDDENPYGFIGRDRELLDLERAMRKPTPAILIQGLGGVGKTTLARGFVKWLRDTEGMDACVWLSFVDVRSAEYVINVIGRAVLSPDFVMADRERDVGTLARALKEERVVVVWDNFEAAAGIEGSYVRPNLSEADRGILLALLRKMRGGKGKVIITSRSEEDWLGTARLRVPIGGLTGWERWEFCETILDGLGLSTDRSDPDQVKLMELLAGHPLAMRAILPRLEKMTARQVITAVRSNMHALGPEATSLEGTLRFAEDQLDEALRPLLVPLGLHEKCVHASLFELMAGRTDGDWTRAMLDRFLGALARAGLVRDLGQAIFDVHPLLTGFLRTTVLASATVAERDGWTRAFVDVMARLANDLVPRPLREKRACFHWHSANFRFALEEAVRLGMETHQTVMMHSLAAYAQDIRDFAEGQRLCEGLVAAWQAAGDKKGEARAYHQLGRIAEDQRDFDAAREWYLKSLAIKEKQNDEHGAAGTYHHLGIIAAEQRDFPAARNWYLKSLAIKEKENDEHGAARTYHNLGVIAEEQRDFAAARRCYLKALAILEKRGIPPESGGSYHHLGRIAEEERDFAAAREWYLKSLAISDKQGDKHGAAKTYHHLGRLADEQRDFDAAREWYLKSLAIEEKQNDEHGAAMTYHQLGVSALEQRDFDTARGWYLKALAIFEKYGMDQHSATTYQHLGAICHEQRAFANAREWYMKALATQDKQKDDRGAATTYHQLGSIAREQMDFAAAREWYLKALAIFEEHGIDQRAAVAYDHLGLVAEKETDFAAARKWYLRALATKEKQNDEHGVAMTFHQLGTVAEAERDFAAAREWYLKSLAIKEKQNNEHGAAITHHQLGNIAYKKRDFTAAREWYMKSLAIKEKEHDDYGAAITYGQLGVLAGIEGDFEQAGTWLIKSVKASHRSNDPEGVKTTAHNSAIVYGNAPAEDKRKLAAMWREAGLPPLPEMDEDG